MSRGSKNATGTPLRSSANASWVAESISPVAKAAAKAAGLGSAIQRWASREILSVTPAKAETTAATRSPKRT
jgi:hypothetical protein